MSSIETTSRPEPQRTLHTEKSATDRPPYVWLCAVVAVLTAAFSGAMIPVLEELPPALGRMNRLALLVITLIFPTALAAAGGLVLKRARGETLLVAVGWLWLTLFGLGLLALVSNLRADYPGGDVTQRFGVLYLALGALGPAISVWISILAVHRKSNRLAAVALVGFGLLFCVSCAFFVALTPGTATQPGLRNQ